MMRIFSRAEGEGASPLPPLHLYNSLGGETQEFTMPDGQTVRMYNCGPTVYGRQHIGNLSAAVFADTLRRVLQYNGFSVRQTINITDFGHLTSDADSGEDKMAKGLRQEGLPLTMENMHALATKYMEAYFADIRALGVRADDIQFPRASEHVPGEIAMIQTLMEKGYAYQLADGVYFDTERFPTYGELGNVRAQKLMAGARVAEHEGKRHPHDFALWKTSEELGWDSPWGKGFPGWHIECSAMARATLGEQIDIHTGGVEHVAIHHNNEIAQSEAASGKRPFARFWMHRAHIQIEGAKIAKSEGNVVYLSEVLTRGFLPLSLRYLFLGAHYRTPMSFTWESLAAAHTALLRLCRTYDDAAAASEGGTGTAPEAYIQRFRERINDDLDTPGALAVVWEMLKDGGVPKADLAAALREVDEVFGLGITTGSADVHAAYEKEFGVRLSEAEVPADVATLVAEREAARKEKNWTRADELRAELAADGYTVEDGADGPVVVKK